MILVDADDAKSQPPDDDAVDPPADSARFGSVRPQPPTAVELPGRPPSYSASYHTPPRLPPSPPPSYPKQPSARQHPAPPPPAAAQPDPRRPSPARRFWSAFACALVLYLALATLARTLVHMASGGFHANAHSAGTPRPEDGRVLESVGHRQWTSRHPNPQWAPGFPNGAETSFALPVASQELYLISRGSYQSGKVKVRQSSAQGEQARVDVRVAYHDERALERGTLCRLYKSGNRNGVGIYTPSSVYHSTREQLLFDVVITFPAAPSADTPLNVHKLTLLTSNFGYAIGDVWQSMFFEEVELATSNSPIRVGSITLARGSMTSSNNAITGHFNASGALRLLTSNGPIRASASLLSAGRDPIQLDMHTSNSPIESTVWLTTETGSGGNFCVNARSSNGPIVLGYEDAPERARLVSDVRTSNAAATVRMHPAFEGDFVVSTSNSQSVVRDTRPLDPTGQGRRRDVSRAPSSSRNQVSGYVRWEGRTRRGEGTCKVHTSNGRASLDL